jgi:hypothetical protein
MILIGFFDQATVIIIVLLKQSFVRKVKCASPANTVKGVSTVSTKCAPTIVYLQLEVFVASMIIATAKPSSALKAALDGEVNAPRAIIVTRRLILLTVGA